MALSMRRMVDVSSDGFNRSNPRGIGSPLGGCLRPLRVGRRQLRRQLPFARRLGGRSRRLERRGEHGVRLPVGGIPADGFAQPEDRRRRVLLRPVRVAEVEVVVGVVPVELEGLVEVVRRDARPAA